MSEIKDSGHRRTFDTGAQRDRAQGKGRYDLLSPVFIDRLARHLEAGARKYADRNWELGMPVVVFLDSALRHLFQYLAGDRDEDHLAAAAFNVQGALHTEEMCRRGVLPMTLMEGFGVYGGSTFDRFMATEAEPNIKPGKE